MDKKTQYLLIVGIVVCLVIAVLSPFIASGDPDGLEKSAEDASVPDGVESALVNAPMPDYTIGDSSIGEIAALVIGIFITLILGWAVAYVVRKN
ncbi:PDGLE domain-containing protein [Methanobrevibacter boviskoreani]|uniref:PDGLE domain-containing protein n=1 Tax=Methanobrevibacter boviskoreani TaxID=1348249 RepID=UPI0023A8FAB0|nr:PDGLE domain-containing protein [Methanobrevibacter boviskoreani]MCI6774242.1 PDGLE domain-containing protein [Methanobrevibacter boviskoreani]MCI6931213.1 PDGLE domain-containing protein [Methanobrevibacter boviskoreani]MDY5615166.1 PDGLE domain-containing protein [Methanobrevibacter boviskoreani]